MTDGVLVSANHDDDSSATYTLTALRAFIFEAKYKISSESYDYLTIRLNGLEVTRVSGTPYGWENLTLELKEGDTVTFTYKENGELTDVTATLTFAEEQQTVTLTCEVTVLQTVVNVTGISLNAMEQTLDVGGVHAAAD